MTDLAGFDDFVMTSAGPLKQAAFLLTGDRQSAEDLVQATMLRLYERWGRSAEWVSPLAYARTTLFSIFVSWGRRRRLREIPYAVLPDEPVQGHEEASDTSALVLAALRDLPTRQRAVVVLHYYEGLDAAAIGSIMNCTAATARSQLSRALTKLRTNDRIGSIIESERI